MIWWIGIFAGNFAVASVSIFVAVRHARHRLILEDDAESQREAIALLLEDFESGASEWLWQTNSTGRLQDVAPRFAEVLQQPATALTDLTLIEALQFKDAREADKLVESLRRGNEFCGLIVDVVVDDQTRHLKFSGKPIAGSRPNLCWRGVGSDITAEVSARRELQKLAQIDSLTGLTNRHHLMAKIDERLTLPEPTPASFLLFDLDDFKSINDTLGHDAGDQLLREVAHRMLMHLQPGDLLGRLGGDEFVLLRNGHLDDDDAQALYAQIRAELGAPYKICGQSVQTGLSCGLARVPVDGDNGSELLAHADLALYASKRAGGGILSCFHPELAAANDHRRETVERLRKAIHENELFLRFQPIVDPHTNSVTSFEALVRWQHPDRGVVGPNEFIPLAEESGLIGELGEWVIRNACEAARSLPPDTSISVNISARQLRGGNLEGQVVCALHDSELDPRRLALEITESLLVAQVDGAQAQLERIRSYGVTVALDDFGTGFSSLYLLRSLPIDRLKVDRAFVVDLGEEPAPEAMELVKAIVSMARALGLETVIEGIETTKQLTAFTALGIDAVQGFVFAPPLSLPDALAFDPTLGCTDERIAA